ncbi:CMP/dCMP kinase [Candidatus Hakubella thermalkaliphila]|uniref:Cytidylate kinase n=5 Tax=Candidatus Hakubella thermalkaliphila TaxID=2754717 RepID=A0A6V8PZI4_9ACTN|nr:(d)CMP kinase [Candidatus Hakubella thermalkaliphila]GFP36496.1 CMP/dCMP kinase [Candidatus Hakubella thermalkaliphila]
MVPEIFNQAVSRDLKEDIITIDGPSGAGKSTIARQVAEKLNFRFLNTGSMYRSMTWLALQRNISFDDEARIIDMARNIHFAISIRGYGEEDFRIEVDGHDVTHHIRSLEVERHVSQVARISGVRRILVQKQREIIQEGGWVVEGRDIGSVVCPQAILKIFLTASSEERVKRRREQFHRGPTSLTGVELEDVEKEMNQRDWLDSTRDDSPLIEPPDSLRIDTTGKSAEEVVEEIMAAYGRSRHAGRHN